MRDPGDIGGVAGCCSVTAAVMVIGCAVGWIAGAAPAGLDIEAICGSTKLGNR